ncbi:hypothetical protein I3A51_08945 [Salmonella enterica]|nr:hypothetical protein [Salmonella enterica]MBH0649577.1 hypothetical protein [Salmonella enterica]
MNNALILNNNNILSTGFIVDLRSNTNVTKGHITLWLSNRLLCNCQDFENLALEDVDIMPKDASHVDVTARAYRFNSRLAKTRQLRCSGRRLCYSVLRGHG